MDPVGLEPAGHPESLGLSGPGHRERSGERAWAVGIVGNRDYTLWMTVIPGEAPAFVHELRVRYGECDPQGIVFNANYMLYFDVAVTELWREAVGPWAEMVGRGVDCVVAETNLRFRASARNDEIVQLHVRILEFGRTSVTIGLNVVRDQQVLVEGRSRYVFVDAASWEKREIPDWIRSGLASFAVQPEKRDVRPSSASD